MTPIPAKKGHLSCFYLFYSGLLIDLLMWYSEGYERSLSVLFNHGTVETLRMRWLKRKIWKAGIAFAGMLLLLVLVVWVPVSVAGAQERASGLATPGTGTGQATSIVDATATVLSNEKLKQEIQQLKNQNEQFKNQNAPDFFVWFPGWLRTNAAVLLSTLVVVIGGLIGLFRWFGDRRSERDKRAEEHFQSAVTGLGDEKEGAKIGAAILLRTFLRPGYEQFYTQTFDLAVANLRLRRTSLPSEDPDGIPHSAEDLDTPLPLTTLRQALIMVFKEAFPLARSQNKKSLQSLDASDVQLDRAYLRGADLKQAWMRRASLRKAKLREAALSKADLREATLREATLPKADLSEATLMKADLRGADLSEATLSKARLTWADLSGADLSRATLTEADLRGATLTGADPKVAKSLKGTDLRGVIGLTKEQLKACKAKDAIIDEDTTTSPSQSPVSPPTPLQSNSTQAPSAQANTPTPGTDENSAPSSQQGAEP